MGFLEFAVEEAVMLEGLAVGEGIFVVEFWVVEVSVLLTRNSHSRTDLF